jgi:hypothetical protein
MRPRALSTVLLTLALTVPAAATAGSPREVTVVYDDFQAPGGYTLSTYASKWANIYGLLDMDPSYPGGDTRSFADGTFSIDDAPFRGSIDFSVYDHLKYMAISNASFPVPGHGSLTFSSRIQAVTPGTEQGHVVHGTYGPPFSYPAGAAYSKVVLEGQQAGAVMNMINFATGQLFDWFISGSTAFTLIERLPSSVTNPSLPSSSPDWVGPEKMYTQIVDEVRIAPGVAHDISITYTRGTGNGDSTVEYFLDGKRVSRVNNVGIPLDKQPGQHYTGIYPSFGQGEDLRPKLDSFVIGQGLFSLIDEFPYQWGWNGGPLCDPGYPAVCAASVSIPVSERLFGQGVRAHFDDFAVTTTTK